MAPQGYYEELYQTNLTRLDEYVIDIMRKSGGYLREHAFDYGIIEWKKKDDPVTILDKNVEKHIRQELSLYTDKIGCVGEEFPASGEQYELRAYIDPIDGTKSFVRGEFLSSISIGIEDGRFDGTGLFAGYVYDFMRDMLYMANYNCTKLLYGRENHNLPIYANPIFSRPTISFDDGLEETAKHFQKDYSVRKQTGSIALAMAQLAAGGYDGLIMPPKTKSHSYDIAGGLPILKGAGYLTLDAKLNELDWEKPINGMIFLKPSIADKFLKEWREYNGS